MTRTYHPRPNAPHTLAKIAMQYRPLAQSCANFWGYFAKFALHLHQDQYSEWRRWSLRLMLASCCPVGSVAVWQCGSVAVWLCGSVEVWQCGSVASCPVGTWALSSVSPSVITTTLMAATVTFAFAMLASCHIVTCHGCLVRYQCPKLVLLGWGMIFIGKNSLQCTR